MVMCKACSYDLVVNFAPEFQQWRNAGSWRSDGLSATATMDTDGLPKDGVQ
jgi:hypothetical protein